MGISAQQALDCFRSDDLIGIGMEADAIRRRLHPDGVVSYRCLLELDVESSQPSARAAAGSVALRLNCGTAASLRKVADLCTEALKEDPARWVEVGLHSHAVALDLTQRLSEWRDYGVKSIFVDSRQQNANYGAATEAALAIHRAAHALGIRTVLGIPFGCGESPVERLSHLEEAYRLQQETGGFAAFVLLGLDAPGGRELDGVTAVDRLKMLAIARMFLDNIEHAQSIQAGPGLKVLQTGLRFGADDVELRMPQPGTTEQDLRRVIRDAGFRPVERNGSYSTLFLG